MTLAKYKKKRSFSETPEPRGKKVSSRSKNLPVFCIQKHDASRLHYDFRLECQGVMISWAIPKGPSLDPSEKHLAVHVEDHPLEYRHFEGIIPEGNYGAGTVMIWDEGTFTVKGAETKKEIENALTAGLADGRIEMELHGEKLKGKFALIRLKKDEDKDWLFFKMKDSEVNTKHKVTDLDRSVRTQRSLDEIANGVSKLQKKKP